MLAAQAGIAYQFWEWSGAHLVPSSAWAPRWNESDFPLKFRLVENEYLPEGWSWSFMRSVVEESFAAWNAVPTSTFRAELEEERWVADRSEKQGINEISFVPDLGRSRASIETTPEGFSECDILLNPPIGAEDAARPRLTYVLMHELGHCLGLSHSEPYPQSFRAIRTSSIFLPPPVMAYAWDSQPELSEDDRIGASLLYPTSRFARSVGSVGGQITVRGEPVRFVYVQSFRPGSLPEPGPGTFADENGQFLLEGLEPGPVLLWLHPILNDFAHPGFIDQAAAPGGSSAIQDQWRWVIVAAGETLIIPDIETNTGRHEARR